MATEFDHLSDTELRTKLRETFGIDVPVSVNRDFLVNKLKKLFEDGNKNGGSTARRRSTGRASVGRVDGGFKIPDSNGPTPTSANNRNKSPSRAKPAARLSYQPQSSTASKNRNNNASDYAPRRSMEVTNSRGSIGTPNSRTGSQFLSFNASTDESDSDFDMTAPSPSVTVSPGGGDADSSWSSRPNPATWTRFSSLFPTPLNSMPPTTFATPLTDRNARVSMYNTSTSTSNGNWRHSITTQVTPGTSRYSTPPARRSNTGTASHDFGGPKKSFIRKLKDCFGGSGSTDGSGLISTILVVLAILFFGMIAMVYINLSSGNSVPALDDSANTVKSAFSSINLDSVTMNLKNIFGFGPKAMPTTLSNNYPICGQPGVDLKACVRADHLRGARMLFTLLKEELVQRARWSRCWLNENSALTLAQAKSNLLRLSSLKKHDVEDCYQEMLVLCVENPNWGLKVMNEDGTKDVEHSKDLFTIDHSKATIAPADVKPSAICNLIGYGQAGFKYLFTFACASLVTYGFVKISQYYVRKKKEEELELYTYIDNAMEMVQAHHDTVKEQGDGDNFIAVNHIRDSLIPAKDRLKKQALWDKVVNYISNYESRIRGEIQHISGEEFRVWGWLPNATTPMSTPRSRMSTMSPSMNSNTPPGTPGNNNMTSNAARPPVGTPLPAGSKWQGKAFDTAKGSPNAVPNNSPTNCLKVRHMFTAGASEDHIQNSILEKCVEANIYHIGVERSSNEGCVYVRCATKEDAGNAFKALHGWWFDGNLLSVKFLREERYFIRFPEAKGRNTSLRRQ